jgi:L-arabinose transport system substrate-binding protein
LAVGALSAPLVSRSIADENVKIGFVVKPPEEPWFQDEWRFAEQAGKEKGFTVIKIGAVDGEKVITAIDSLASQKARGFIICHSIIAWSWAHSEKGKDIVARRAWRRFSH